MATDFDLVIDRARLNELAPALLASLREFVGYGLCRQGNTFERKSLAEKYAALAHDALKQFPDLKLNHCGAKTVVTDTDPEKVWACIWQTRHWDRGVDLCATEAEAWLGVGDYIDVSDMTEAEASEFWGLLDKGDADSMAEFRRIFYERLEPTGHEVTIEQVELPKRGVK